MSTVIPTLSEDKLYSVASEDLMPIGLRKGDLISIVQLNRYFVGDTVIALVDGFYQIGKLRHCDSCSDFELVTLTGNQTLVSQIKLEDIVGFVQKERQEILTD